MASYCEPVSVLALGAVMGLGDVDADTLRRWFGSLALGGANFESDPAKQETADAASAEIDRRVMPLLDRLEAEPDDSVLSQMLHVEPPSGGRLSKPEVLSNLKLILLGGMQEPGHALGITLWALLSHPEALAEVRDDPRLLSSAVEEALRWHSPVGTQTRQVTERTEIAGVELEPGTVIAAVLSSANRDERHWEDPGRFDIHRGGAHAGFGLGAAPLRRRAARAARGAAAAAAAARSPPRACDSTRSSRSSCPAGSSARRCACTRGGIEVAEWVTVAASAEIADGEMLEADNRGSRSWSPAPATACSPSRAGARTRSARWRRAR